MKTFPEVAFTVAFSPDGAQAVVAGTNLAIYGVANGALIRKYADAGSYYMRAVATTPDGRAFMRTRHDGQIFCARLPLWINALAPAGNTGRLSWSGGGGKYQLQLRTNIADVTWQDFGAIQTNRTAEVPLQSPSALYRVIALPD